MLLSKPIKPFIIPLFIPHIGCPFQCAFCNQKALTSISRQTLSIPELKSEIDLFLSYKKDSQDKEIAFYGGTFLGLNEDHIVQLLELAESYIKNGTVKSIRFSTRPDTISTQTLDILGDYSVETIEIGVQSMDDKVLKESNRGHTEDDVINAVNMVKERGYKVGMQLMVGLPGDSEKIALETAIKTVTLKPDMVRIYPALVLRDSPMEEWFQKGKYSPLSLDDSVETVKKMYTLFLKENINVIRVGIQSSKDLKEGSEIIAGPYHPAYGHMVFSSIFLDMAVQILSRIEIHDRIDIHVNPSKVSEMRGLKNRNIAELEKKYRLKKISVIEDSSMDKYSLSINNIKTGINDLANEYVKH
jgi:histone acetyltransferase (RNA polymerase elongator complex component)